MSTVTFLILSNKASLEVVQKLAEKYKLPAIKPSNIKIWDIEDSRVFEWYQPMLSVCSGNSSFESYCDYIQHEKKLRLGVLNETLEVRANANYKEEYKKYIECLDCLDRQESAMMQDVKNNEDCKKVYKSEQFESLLKQRKELDTIRYPYMAMSTDDGIKLLKEFVSYYDEVFDTNNKNFIVYKRFYGKLVELFDNCTVFSHFGFCQNEVLLPQSKKTIDIADLIIEDFVFLDKDIFLNIKK